MIAAPRYWGSWKGKVINAISVEGAITWDQIQEKTALDSADLNTVLYELFQLELIARDGQFYRMRDLDIRNEYRNYDSKINQNAGSKFIVTPEMAQEAREWVANSRKYFDGKKLRGTIIEKMLHILLTLELGFPFESEHIFLNDDRLDRISKDLISKSIKEVIILNPFVDECSLSDKLKEVTNVCSVKLLTRNPESERETYSKKSKIKCHKALMQNNVEVRYNDRIHSKLIFIDDLIAVVSSMNLYSGSTGGKSKEAGIVTWEKNNVDAIRRYINSNWDESEIATL